MKVLYVATVVKTHIMEFHIPYLEMFKEMGWDTAVAARNDYENPADCLIPHCDTYFDIPFERSPLKFGNIRAFRQLKKVIDTGEYDIIHCHTPVGALLTRLAALKARKKGTRVFYTAHGFHFYKGAPLKNWLIYYPVERFLAHFTDVLITINKEDYERAKSFKAGRVEYVPGVGIDISKYRVNNEKRLDTRCKLRHQLRIPEDATVLLSVGELNSNKNHKVVIECLPELANVWYVICGQGPLMEEHRKLAETLGIAERLILAGYRTDVADFYNMADVFVFPSRREGLPVALMEAMACGLPAICSNIRGNADLIESGKDGEIVESTAPSVAEAIIRLKNNSSLRIQYSEKAQETVKQFDLCNIKNLMKEIYKVEIMD